MITAARASLNRRRRRAEDLSALARFALRAGLACMLSSGILTCTAVRGAAQTPGEYQVKAAFLYNFARFVEWPATAFESGDSPFVIGVLGDDPFGGVLDQTVSGKSAGGRPMVVRRVKPGPGVRTCHILFVSTSMRDDIRGVVAELGVSPILTVSDIERFAQAGGMIGLVMSENRVRFEINARQAGRSGLRISSKLLSLAVAIRK